MGALFWIAILDLSFSDQKVDMVPISLEFVAGGKICRKYYDEDADQEFGSYTFYISRKKADING